jgi:RNA polymerase sigma-70 factor (ECF subfamily)
MADSPGKQFGIRVEPHLGRLYRAAWRLTGNQADARDLVQDTCVRAWSRLKQFDAADSPLGWLMRVQYNLFIDGVRQRQRERIRPLEDADAENLPSEELAEPEKSMESAQGLSKVERAWTKLTKEQRGLLALLVEGYRLAEIAEITGLGLNVINARLHRARRSLARQLRSEADQETQGTAEQHR